MQYSLANLLLLSSIIHVGCAENPVDHPLVRRVPTATDLFSFIPSTSPGGCTEAQQALVTSWIADATKLNNAALSAYGFGIGLQDVKHLNNIMGIYFSSPGVTRDTDSYRQMGDRLQAVQTFLTGNGIPDAVDENPPYFFCSDAFAVNVPWDQPALDKNGKNIPDPENEDQLLTVGTLFPNSVGSVQGGYPVQPFWADTFGGYLLQGSLTDKMCFTEIYASTPRERTGRSVVRGVDIELGRFDRLMFFCENGWNERPYTKPGKPPAGLEDIVTYANYPTAGSKTQNLGDFMPISSTFYHELFHLTDETTDPTNDFYGGSARIFGAAIGKIPKNGKWVEDPKARGLVVDNPESYNFFAVASYLARNPPPTTPPGSVRKPGVVFFGGLPRIAE